MENSKYESVIICGWCKKKTQIDDVSTEKIMRGEEGILHCSCGHASYETSMRSKFKVDKNDWRGVYGSGKP
jgi:hypothetical protein